jgi:GDPmannose 4,6-dehydratase
MRTALITGIAGQDGGYLAKLLLSKGYRVVGASRPGSPHRPWCGEDSGLTVIPVELSDDVAVRSLLEKVTPDEIYNLAARASSLHLFADPVSTGEVNGLVVTRLLEAIRTVNDKIRLFQASSSEMFGAPLETPQDEGTVCLPTNAYGAAKFYAHRMLAIYRERFGLFACGGILYNHESPWRGREFVTRQIASGAARVKRGLEHTLVFKNLEAKRDWGFAGDFVDAMWRMLQADRPEDYIVATGKLHSVRQLCDMAFGYLGLDYRQYVSAGESKPQKSTDIVGNPRKIELGFAWRPTLSLEELIKMMVDADLRRIDEVEAAANLP